MPSKFHISHYIIITRMKNNEKREQNVKTHTFIVIHFVIYLTITKLKHNTIYTTTWNITKHSVFVALEQFVSCDSIYCDCYAIFIFCFYFCFIFLLFLLFPSIHLSILQSCVHCYCLNVIIFIENSITI